MSKEEAGYILTSSFPEHVIQPKTFKKRNSSLVPYDYRKIAVAIYRAMINVGEENKELAVKIAVDISALIVLEHGIEYVPFIEDVQDLVEKYLIENKLIATVKHYILYRHEHKEKRGVIDLSSEDEREIMKENSKYFAGNPFGEMVYYRTYSRWMEDKMRRETWSETINRYINFMKQRLGGLLTDTEYKDIRTAILLQKVMPSMRLLQFSGQAVSVNNICAYNCAYIAPKSLRDISEVMYVSMSGTGVCWSVEENIQEFPMVKRQTYKKLPTFIVPDTRQGWCEALLAGLEAWYDGCDIEFDYSLVRPCGARLRTMGGKASGPAPLKELLEFARGVILRNQRGRLSTLDWHDILCKIEMIVMTGNIRRAAGASISKLGDEQMRHCKEGQFWNTNPQRSMANNSVAYETKPSCKEFLDEWLSLMKSGTGERGIFNRYAMIKTLPERRKELFKTTGLLDEEDFPTELMGSNPCYEVSPLRSKQFCNLSEVICRNDDTEETLLEKIRIATIIGTYQSTLTYFPYLSKEWMYNCEQERLLGVSITGQWDCPALRNPKTLAALKNMAIATNEKYAFKFGISQSMAITLCKPSGTVSQLVNCSSGIHPRFSEYYIRRVRIASTDSLYKMLRDQGIKGKPEVGQSEETANTFVLEFPIKSTGTVFVKDLNALQQLEYWKMVKLNYCEHNPSVTIYVKEDEWISVANWVYENFDIASGIAFLPNRENVYQLAPYEEITLEQYEKIKDMYKDIDFSKILLYERKDETDMKGTYACTGDKCEWN